MTALLTENLPLMAGAPNGIKKLRELILELAVRGKLVPQDPSDEPASMLLKRIADDKARLVAIGKLKKQKPLEDVDDAEKPFALPDGWEWVRLGQVTEASTGHAFKSSEYRASGTLVLRVTNINPDGTLDLSDAKYIDPVEADSTYKSVRLERDEILLVMVGGSLGKIGVVDESCLPAVLNQNMWKMFRPTSVSRDYFVYGLRLVNATQLKITSSTHGHLAQGEYLSKLFPLAPEQEQHRIVAKVDELMALCDRLEAQQADAESAHARLVQALLDSLTQASDATDFAANWQRLAEHFHILFTTEPSIDALKQTLLQLAVMGKLVPQDPSDEPARELCKSIEAEKERLVVAKKIKDTPRLEPVSTEEELFTAPPSWVWIRMGDICRPISSGSTPSSELFQYDEGIPFLKVYNIRNQKVDFEFKKQFVTSKHHAEKMKRSILVPGDVIMNIVGPPLGKVAIIPDTFPEWNCNQAIVFFGLIAPMSPQYIYTFLKEGSFLKNIALIGTAGQDNISVTKSKNIAVPLPPLAEQHRIVAKVDQLMALCDQLKTRLTQARQLNEQLASTLVEHAVA